MNDCDVFGQIVAVGKGSAARATYVADVSGFKIATTTPEVSFNTCDVNTQPRLPVHVTCLC